MNPERRRRPRIARCSAALIVALVLAQSAAAHGTTTAVKAHGAATLPAVPIYDGPPGGDSPGVRPGFIVYTGDDSGFFGGAGSAGQRTNAKKLRWSGWTQTEAHASGDNWLDDCKPDCASGKFTPYPVTLTLTRPGHLDGYYVFTLITVTYTGKLPPGDRHRASTLEIRYERSAGGFFF